MDVNNRFSTNYVAPDWAALVALALFFALVVVACAVLDSLLPSLQ